MGSDQLVLSSLNLAQDIAIKARLLDFEFEGFEQVQAIFQVELLEKLINLVLLNQSK